MATEDIERIKGVGSATASKLRAAGFTTVEALAVTPAREVAEKSGLGEDQAFRICEEARRLMNFGFIKATDLWEKRRSMLSAQQAPEGLMRF